MDRSAFAARLVEGPVASTLALFTLPILASNVLQSLNGSVNAIWIGHYLGEAALTATSNANTILFFLLALVFGVAMAATILVAQSIGSRDLGEAKRVVGTSVTFFVAASIAIAVVGASATRPLLEWMRTPSDAMPFAVAYLRVIFIAIPPMFAYALLMMVLRGAGDSRTPFLFLAGAVALDIALNPLLMFGVGPLPRMGIAGSATATLIAQTVSLVALLAWLRHRRHFLWLGRGDRGFLLPDARVLGALVRKGIPMGLQMIVLSASSIVMISFVNRFGSETTAAYGAAFQLWNYVMMPAIAVGMAASAMAAQNVGARRFDRVTRTALAGVGFNVLLTGALVLLIYAFNRSALALFLPATSASMQVAMHANDVVAWSFVLFGISMVLGGVVRSTGAVVPPLVVLFVALWLIRIPFAFALLDRVGPDAVWWSFPLGAFASATLMTLYYRLGNWRAAHMLAPEPKRGAAPAVP
jgi:MATE family, multidrug efflux pump